MVVHEPVMPMGIDDARAEKNRDGQLHFSHQRQQVVVSQMAVVKSDDEGFFREVFFVFALTSSNEIIERDDVVVFFEIRESFLRRLPAQVVIEQERHFVPLNHLSEKEDQAGIAEYFVKEFFHDKAVFGLRRLREFSRV